MLDRAAKMLDQMLDQALNQASDPKKNPQSAEKTPVTLKVHPSTQSQLRGNRNNNLTILTSRYPWAEIEIEPDPSVSVDRLILL
jgi:hypothetical protein